MSIPANGGHSQDCGSHRPKPPGLVLCPATAIASGPAAARNPNEGCPAGQGPQGGIAAYDFSPGFEEAALRLRISEAISSIGLFVTLTVAQPGCLEKYFLARISSILTYSWSA